MLGKLGGILWNTKEYLLPPLRLIALYAFRGQLAARPPTAARNFESAASTRSIACLILIAFTIVLGIHVALPQPRTSQQAIAQSAPEPSSSSRSARFCAFI